MNYESIILEMLRRIQTLEDKVAALENGAARPNAGQIGNKVTTGDIRDYIASCKRAAAQNGHTSLVLRSGTIHRELGLSSRMPQVCNAMRQSMHSGDKVLYETQSGYSSTLQIEYQIGEEQL